MGYFNPAVTIGVFIQQYDYEVENWRKGFTGLLENITFAAICMYMQLLGCCLGLLMFKTFIFPPPEQKNTTKLTD